MSLKTETQLRALRMFKPRRVWCVKLAERSPTGSDVRSPDICLASLLGRTYVWYQPCAVKESSWVQILNLKTQAGKRVMSA